MRKFGRKKQNREMMLRNLATSLIIFEHVKTTEAKAKETKTLIDTIINIGKKNTLESHRRLIGLLTHKNAVKKIKQDLITRYNDRQSGYVKSYHLAPRLGDGSKMMLLQLIAKKKSTKPNTQDTDKKPDETPTKSNPVTKPKEKNDAIKTTSKK